MALIEALEVTLALMAVIFHDSYHFSLLIVIAYFKANSTSPEYLGLFYLFFFVFLSRCEAELRAVVRSSNNGANLMEEQLNNNKLEIKSFPS